MLRLADILAEVQKQLRSIKYQAGKARNYLQYRDRLKELQVNYSLAEYHKLFTACSDKRTDFEKLQENFAALAAEIAKADAAAGELGEKKTAIEISIDLMMHGLLTLPGNIVFI